MKTQTMLLSAANSIPKKILSAFFWKNHLIFTVIPPTRDPIGSLPKPDDIRSALWCPCSCSWKVAQMCLVEFWSYNLTENALKWKPKRKILGNMHLFGFCGGKSHDKIKTICLLNLSPQPAASWLGLTVFWGNKICILVPLYFFFKDVCFVFGMTIRLVVVFFYIFAWMKTCLK